jgi:hypothetical protein
MKTIYKYKICLDSCSIQMYKGAKVLTAELKEGAPYIWALVDTEESYEQRRFCVYGTSWPIFEDENPVYITTLQQENGFVWHLFEATTRYEP